MWKIAISLFKPCTIDADEKRLAAAWMFGIMKTVAPTAITASITLNESYKDKATVCVGRCHQRNSEVRTSVKRHSEMMMILKKCPAMLMNNPSTWNL